MAFDDATQRRLMQFVGQTRTLLADEFTQQLQNDYGLNPRTGGVTPLSELSHLDEERRETARILRETVRHYQEKTGSSPKEALERVTREQAFTVLNRVVALRMAEARGIIVESISRGYQSNGFQMFARVAGGGLGEMGEAYRSYLFSIFDELAVDLRVLFDRYSPSGLLFPRETVLIALLDKVNHADMVPLWGEDETIGWMYEFFNSDAERKAMRDPKQGGSASPRNSYEMAVRNQFFTPRYIVQFLTDNSLGRLWYEMTQGNTSLKDACPYLVRTGDDVFLADPEHCPPSGKALLRLAQTGEEDVLPPFTASDDDTSRLVDLAHVVNGYTRRPLDNTSPHDIGRWLEETERSLLGGEPLARLSTQDLLDLMFVMARRDRMTSMGSSTMDSRLYASLGNEVRRRALEASRTDLSSAERNALPNFIPFRAVKDPREIRLLDPACGSMHFGLYAFDLFETIYQEAYDHPQAGGKLREDYRDREAFLRDVPRLIIEHNLHGVDIDPRAVQIAGLSLWLRAQRSWQEQKVKPAQRHQIRRSNIVCAEPMPGEEGLRREFLASLPPFFAVLVGEVFAKMANADTLGSLLRIEDDLRETIARARREWENQGKRSVQMSLEVEGARHVSVQQEFNLGADTDESFFQQAEAQAIEALRAYSEKVGEAGYTRRLFADDAARGFAFVDLWQKKYDVVVMNPPFGDAALPSKPYIEATYGDTKGDVYKAFIECFQDRLVPGGFLGAITSRTGFFLGQSADWRARVVLRLYRPLLLADLGMGVLNAMVETAAYVLRSLTDDERKALTRSWAERLRDVKRDKNDRFTRAGYEKAYGLKKHQAEQELRWLEADNHVWLFAGVPLSNGSFSAARYGIHSAKLRQPAPLNPLPPPFLCLRLLTYSTNDEKKAGMETSVHDNSSANWFFVRPEQFRVIPNQPFAYWISASTTAKLFKFARLEGGKATIKVGLQTGDDFRFLRQWWEIPTKAIISRRIDEPLGQLSTSEGYGTVQESWYFYTKTDFAVPWYSSLLQVVNWTQGGREYDYFCDYTGALKARPQNKDFYLRPGFSYMLRSARLVPYIVPEGTIPTAGRAQVYSIGEDVVTPLSMCSSNIGSAVARLFGENFERPKFQAGMVQAIPVPPVSEDFHRRLSVFVQEEVVKMRTVFQEHEPFIDFTHPPKAESYADPHSWQKENLLRRDLEVEIGDAFGLKPSELKDLERDVQEAILCQRKASKAEDDNNEAEASVQLEVTDRKSLKEEHLSYALGCGFGRWDIRYSTGERGLSPLTDPFAPLPVCSPGTLKNGGGLPAEFNEVPADYPLPIPWNGILVDDPGHPADIEQRVQNALTLIFEERTDAVEQEACQILGVLSLREYFAKPGLFFDAHLKRYSKSRRQAPLYWPLSTASGSYTLWVYYHRLTDQTLYTAVVDYVEPKLKGISESVSALRARPGRAQADERELERLQDLEADLKTFREELLRVAAFYKPNLNDGVQITAAPLYKLFRLSRWQKTLKETWGKLEDGTYDWAHLAYSIWPDRVAAKCRTDKSLAIAHDREDLYQEPPAAANAKRNKAALTTVEGAEA